MLYIFYEVIYMDLRQLIERLKQLSDIFYDNGIEDIYTNSKIYEVLMSEQFGHKIINGHANTLDAIDTEGNLYEYKHFKLSSTNHTWTFNDFSDATITKLYNVKSVYFAIIDDNPVIHKVKEVYIVKGSQVARYLENSTVDIYNHRKMINISRRQIINNMKYTIIIPDQVQVSNILREVFNVANSIEVLTGIRGILTSNKLWELLVACKLGHRINPEQRKHDAYDQQGRTYEYKVTKKYAWKFQDISENVLESYIQDEKIILAVVDKKEFIVEAIYVCDPRAIVKILRNKLCLLFEQKEDVRRLAATINIGDVRKLIDRGEARCLR